MTPNRTYRLPVVFIALSFVAMLLYSYLLADTDRALPFLDPFGIALDVLWLGVLVWLARDVRRGAPRVKGTLLVLACFVGALSTIDLFGDEARPLLFATGAAEALLLFAASLSSPFVPKPAPDPAKARVGWNAWRVAKYVLVTLAILAAAPVALVAGVVSWWSASGVFAAERFDGEAWARPAAQAEDACHRGRMANDIKKRFLKQGMPKADVERLLGQPDRVSSPREYQYVLGICSGFEIADEKPENDELHIYFNDQGALERAVIRQP